MIGPIVKFKILFDCIIIILYLFFFGNISIVLLTDIVHNNNSYVSYFLGLFWIVFLFLIINSVYDLVKTFKTHN
jgi:hypothetical protein